MADGCDVCPNDPLNDADSDGVCGDVDACPGFDDNVDADSDTVPDGCDVCPGFDDNVDSDSDAVADGCDTCPGFDDHVDSDSDAVADGCDVCPGFDDNVDSDSDAVADGCDVCPGFDDNVDGDSDAVPDGCDTCPADPTNDASDSDGICDDIDNCVGVSNFDQADAESDGVGDVCDNCVDVANGGQEDVDSDAFGAACDCDDGNDTAWALPSEVTGLILQHTGGPNAPTDLSWNAVSDAGGTGTVVFDVLRSTASDDFTAATCVESDDVDLSATDQTAAPQGVVHFFLIRAENGCPGLGSLGSGTGGPRSGVACP